MWWAIIIALLYTPIVYKIHRRLHKLEDEVRILTEKLESKK